LLVVWWAHALDQVRLGRVTLLAYGVMVAVLIGLPARTVLLRWESPLLQSYDALAAQLRPLLPPDTSIMADNTLTAGNLKMVLPEYKVLTPELDGLLTVQTHRWVVVWDTRKGKRDEPPVQLQEWGRRKIPGGLAGASRTSLSAAYRYNTPRVFTIGVMVLDAPASPSR
jgi:hypothetical protein